eukprot:4043076-Ditylum_brightwellii.AAC.1
MIKGKTKKPILNTTGNKTVAEDGVDPANDYQIDECKKKCKVLPQLNNMDIKNNSQEQNPTIKPMEEETNNINKDNTNNS